jgi:hypothetical protein
MRSAQFVLPQTDGDIADHLLTEIADRVNIYAEKAA